MFWIKEAPDHIFGCAHTGLLSEDSGYRSHLLLVGFLAFSPTDLLLREFRLDHGDALAIDGPNQNGAAPFLLRNFPARVETLKVNAGLNKDVLGASLWNPYAGSLLEGFNRLIERTLDYLLVLS